MFHIIDKYMSYLQNTPAFIIVNSTIIIKFIVPKVMKMMISTMQIFKIRL